MATVADSDLQDVSEGSQSLRSNWYLRRREIEDNSPSRKDGIDLKKENQLRKLYCSFLQDVGVKLKVPPETLATAMMLCHRFFLRQSHAKNEWQTIATVSMFLASKLEETPRLLKDVIVVAYETMYRWDPNSAQRIKQKDVYEKQKKLILTGETLLLCTIGFDFNIQHPFKPLIAAAKRLKITQNVWKSAWSYVNTWLRTTLCLQYKPHYIAAGSMFLAAKFHKVKLPSEKGMVWWQQFDVTPQQLEEVIQQMNKIQDQNRRSEVPCTYDKTRQTPAAPEKVASTSSLSSALTGSVVTSESCHIHDKDIGMISSANAVNPDLPCSRVLACGDIHFANKGDLQCQLHAKENGVSLSVYSVDNDSPGCHDLLPCNKGDIQHHPSDCGSAHSVVEDCGKFNEVALDQAMPSESDQIVGSEMISVKMCLTEMDKDRIRAKLKRRRLESTTNKMAVITCSADNDNSWIEIELENGIDVKERLEKKPRCYRVDLSLL